jgi:hypothetical protein
VGGVDAVDIKPKKKEKKTSVNKKERKKIIRTKISFTAS